MARSVASSVRKHVSTRDNANGQKTRAGHICIVQPSTAIAAWRTASVSVGCE